MPLDNRDWYKDWSKTHPSDFSHLPNYDDTPDDLLDKQREEASNSKFYKPNAFSRDKYKDIDFYKFISDPTCPSCKQRKLFFDKSGCLRCLNEKCGKRWTEFSIELARRNEKVLQLETAMENMEKLMEKVSEKPESTITNPDIITYNKFYSENRKELYEVKSSKNKLLSRISKWLGSN